MLPIGSDGGTPGTLMPQASNLNDDVGFYAAKVVLSALTYELTPITTVGIIGSATEQGWDASTPMEWDTTEKCWVITTTLKGGAGYELKFRGNDDWDEATGNGAVAGTTSLTVQTPTYRLRRQVLQLSSSILLATARAM